MTWRHVILLVASMAMVTICEAARTLEPGDRKDVQQLAGLVIVGTLGHAGHASKTAAEGAPR